MVTSLKKYFLRVFPHVARLHSFAMRYYRLCWIFVVSPQMPANARFRVPGAMWSRKEETRRKNIELGLHGVTQMGKYTQASVNCRVMGNRSVLLEFW